MIGVVLIGHGKIASEMLLAVEHVLGKQSLMAAFNVLDSDQADTSHDELLRLIEQNDTGHGVLVFADMFGGTPCNIALSCADYDRCEIVSGFNLPALIKAVALRQKTNHLKDIAKEAIISGQQYMCIASDFMASPKEDVPYA